MDNEQEVPRRPDRRVPAGTSPGYVSPYGKIAGLAERLAKFRQRLCTDRSLPWQGTGLIADLEVVVRLLNVQEFVDDLRVHGDEEQARWAAELLEIIEDADEHERLIEEIEQAVPVAAGQEYGAAIAEAAALGDRMRAVLVEVGALAENDTETDPVAMLRALLS
jgi:hypothetical protein